MKPGRIPCEVVSCRRTAPAAKYPPDTIICCGKCWRLADQELRRRWRAARRECERLEAAAEPLEGGGWSFNSKEAYVRHREVWADEKTAWSAIIAQANEARAGIG